MRSGPSKKKGGGISDKIEFVHKISSSHSTIFFAIYLKQRGVAGHEKKNPS
jgi:hypothetical protein